MSAKVKVLITGGCGFIGSNFIHHVLRERSDWEIVNLDKLTYAGNPLNLKEIEGDPRYRFVKGDIADAALVERLLQEHACEVVVNFAAESHVDRSILDASPFVRTNIEGTQVLLEAARTFEVKRFVQVSTDEVYGSIENGAFTESSPLQPNSPYAASKAAADLLCRAYHKTYGLPVIITRSSNNYGPYQFPEKLIPLMILNALQGKPLPVYGKGENVRDWLFVEDNCRAIALVIEKGREGEIYNIGGNCEKRNIEVVELICDILRDHPETQDLRPRIQFVKDRPGHDWRYALDISKTKRLGWEPSVNLERGLRLTIDWYLAHQGWVKSVVSGDYQAYYDQVYVRQWGRA